MGALGRLRGQAQIFQDRLFDGGDGKGPGVGGKGGDATSHGTGMDIDGSDGADGEWCFNFDQWYIYFSTIADGTIAPGSDLQLGTYTDQNWAPTPPLRSRPMSV